MTRRIRVGIVAGAAVAMSSGAMLASPTYAATPCSGAPVCVKTYREPGYRSVQVLEGKSYNDVTGVTLECGTGLYINVTVKGSSVGGNPGTRVPGFRCP